MIKRLKYLYSDNDRHGNQRHYFCPPGHKKYRIRHAPGTAAAKAEYTALFTAYQAGTLKPVTRAQVSRRGSIEWLLDLYQASVTFAALAPSTRLQRSNFYTRYCRVHGDVPFDEITPQDLRATRDALKPFAARNFLKSMSAAYKWACDDEQRLAKINPAAAVKKPSPRTLGHLAWSLDDVMQFKDHYPLGSNPRKCLAMILFTAREISAVRSLGRSDVRDGMIRNHRAKTWAEASTPVLQTLRDELGDSYGDLMWLRTRAGQPYSVKSLSTTFSAWARAAGLERRTAHGLRKSIGTILADLGYSENTIMAVLAHDSPGQAQVYVQGANKRRLATEGMRAIEGKIAHLWNSGKV